MLEPIYVYRDMVGVKDFFFNVFYISSEINSHGVHVLRTSTDFYVSCMYPDDFDELNRTGKLEMMREAADGKYLRLTKITKKEYDDFITIERLK